MEKTLNHRSCSALRRGVRSSWLPMQGWDNASTGSLLPRAPAHLQSFLLHPPLLPPPSHTPSPTPEISLLAASDSIHSAEKPVNSCRRESWEDLKRHWEREATTSHICIYPLCGPKTPPCSFICNVCQRVFQPYCCTRPYFATYNTQLASLSPYSNSENPWSTSLSPTQYHITASQCERSIAMLSMMSCHFFHWGRHQIQRTNKPDICWLRQRKTKCWQYF